MKTRLLSAAVITAALLSGCAAQPDHLLLSPIVTTQANLPATNLQVEVEDHRVGNYLVKINENDDRHRLIAPAEKLTVTLKRGLLEAFNQQGARTGGHADVVVTVVIEQMLTSVEQSVLKYDAVSEAQVTAIIQAADTTLRKPFSAKRSRSEPLKPAMATLESDLNQLMEILIRTIVDDEEVNQFLQEHSL